MPGLRPPSPSRLEFLSQHVTGGSQCTSVRHRQNEHNNILLGCVGGMKLFHRDTRKVEHFSDIERPDVDEFRGEVFMASLCKYKVDVYRYEMFNRSSHMLFTFQQNSDNASFISATARHVAVLNRDDDVIMLYNRKSRSLCAKKLPGLKRLSNLVFLNDGISLLATGDSTVNKYCLFEDEPALIWSCGQVPGAYGVAGGDGGLIYVSGMDNHTLYILSAEGWLNHKFRKSKRSLKSYNFISNLLIRSVYNSDPS